MLFCAECSRAVVSAGCSSAYARSSARSCVPSAVELLSLRGASQLTPALLYLVQLSCCFCVVLVSLRTLFYTECSRSVVSAWCWSTHACSSIPSAVDLSSLRGAGQLTRALLYLVQLSCCLCVGLVSLRTLSCTECSRADYRAVLVSP